MSLTLHEKKGPSIAPLDDGTYPAVCYLLADIGEQQNERYNKLIHQVVIGWEIVGETVQIDGETKPRVFFATYTASLDVKSKLRSALKSWRGRDFTPEELAGFDLKNIIGAPCFVTITTTTTEDGRQYSNLAGVAKLPKGFGALAATLPPIMYDMDTDPPEKVNDLPEWIQKKVRSSPSFCKPKFEELPSSEYGGDGTDGELPF